MQREKARVQKDEQAVVVEIYLCAAALLVMMLQLKNAITPTFRGDAADSYQEFLIS